eukprot:CAMPEP_0114279490 /NCGR_PEP_ID=MMETSP0059-20121206/1912_1 /TAXON_ID=36894 /ORGANISM="Pyramimonas parkeae, Strain CCMP726" /LENGTH=110 /DNA_ID=CAMNT_0001399787 /DNA_START=578 /DNA_END=910 /DNA_ORIENTATION=+
MVEMSSKSACAFANRPGLRLRGGSRGPQNSSDLLLLETEPASSSTPYSSSFSGRSNPPTDPERSDASTCAQYLDLWRRCSSVDTVCLLASRALLTRQRNTTAPSTATATV